MDRQLDKLKSREEKREREREICRSFKARSEEKDIKEGRSKNL